MAETEFSCAACGEEKDVIHIEYDYKCRARYDGISEIYCQKCGKRTGRWTRKILAEGEVEWPHGRERKERRKK